MYPNNKTKAATALGVNLADPPSSLLGSVGSTPLKDVTNILIAYGDNKSGSVNPTVVDEPLQQNHKGSSGTSWYTRLSDKKEAAYLEKLRLSCQQKKK